MFQSFSLACYEVPLFSCSLFTDRLISFVVKFSQYFINAYEIMIALTTERFL